mmetsp:Transcript_2541/g.7454  ORF Transcript_2541/g.7454 Transcript_2541/m.7454 type:complete len:466 (-) Transcript_2541:72-1469(-)
MASQVVTNFEKHLAQLTVGASRESIQTLSKYMAFNRKKHGTTLCEALSNAIRTKATTPGRKMLYLNVAHEVLISESPLQAGYQNDKKWDRLADLRSQLGETVVVDAIASVRDCAGTSEADLDKIRNWIEQWEEIEAFGGPTIVLGARRALTAEKAKQVEPAVEEKAEAPSPSDGAAAVKETATSESAPPAQKETPPAATDDDDAKAATESKAIDVTSPTPKGKVQEDANDSKASSVKDESDVGATTPPPVDMPPAFDFEAESIPFEKVEPHQLLASCRSLATMQISRDLRNDTAVRISTALSTLSPDVEAACRKALEDAGGDRSKVSIDLDSIPSISDDVLDINIGDGIKTVQQYREIILKQREARKALIEQIIKSRCKFGSAEAAEAFFGIGSKEEKLKKRRDLLQDAMELEGLDVLEEEEAKGGNMDADLGGNAIGELPPLTWYEKEVAAAGGEPQAKKARVE